MDALKLFVQQLVKNLEKQPGWVPLLLLSYVAMPFLHVSERVALAFRYSQISRIPMEVLAVLFTYVLYLLGDALDKAVWKRKRSDGRVKDRFTFRRLKDARDKAQDAFGVQEGIYAASMALTTAAEKEFPRTRIHIANESAKFLRSLAIPMCVISLYYLFQGRLVISSLLLLVAVLTVSTYVYLKSWHMQELYIHVIRLKGMPNLVEANLAGIRLFFWDGIFVSSAKLMTLSPLQEKPLSKPQESF
jgi:hypothetical protein